MVIHVDYVMVDLFTKMILLLAAIVKLVKIVNQKRV